MCATVSAVTIKKIVNAATLPSVGLFCPLACSSQPATASFNLHKQSNFTVICAFSQFYRTGSSWSKKKDQHLSAHTNLAGTCLLGAIEGSNIDVKPIKESMRLYFFFFNFVVLSLLLHKNRRKTIKIHAGTIFENIL